MKRLIALTMIIFITFGSWTLLDAINSKPKITLSESNTLWCPDMTMQSVCHIEADAGWQGSGSYIGNGLILTAGHVVDGAYNFKIIFEDGTVYESNRTYLCPTVDVGFIYIGDINRPSLEFDNDGFSRGSEVFVFGNPLGWDFRFSVTKGIVSNITRDCEGFFGEKLILQVDAASYPGNSGGPVTDNEGEIVGILVGGIGHYENLSLCVSVDVCRQAMNIYMEMLKMDRLQ